MMKIYDQSLEINKNSNWPCIPNHPFSIIGGSRSGKTNLLLT